MVAASKGPDDKSPGRWWSLEHTDLERILIYRLAQRYAVPSLVEPYRTSAQPYCEVEDGAVKLLYIYVYAGEG